ncbi:MAG: DUF4139 domain-containing protein [Alphaproteobacteria bacterium]
MKRFIAALMVSTVLTSAAYAAEMPVNSVILSTSGLANFEHRAKVDGNAKLEFPVRFEQVDDILKSLIVFDAQGRIGGVTLPGKQPLAQVFKDLPFTQDQLSNPSTLLNAYQGAMVTVSGPTLKASGKLLQVVPEETSLGDDKTTTKNRVSIMTGEGIKSALLEDLQSVSFDDPKIKADVARALDAIRENGTAERRMLTLNLLGQGNRDVTLSYVVDAPLWKTAYRMVVPEAGAKTGLLQGWAVVENMTASDWNDVDLTLVSGNPVTFRQQLYQSYYVSRPEIPVQVFGRVMPRVDAGTLATAEQMEADEGSASPRGRMGEYAPKRKGGMPMLAGGMAAPSPAAAPMAMAEMAMDSVAPMEAVAATNMASVSQAANAAQSSEATTQVLFRFPDHFDLKSGQSMMVPFVSREVPMERVSLYQPETHPTHPLAAVEIKNDGESGLPPGVLTLYEESKLLNGTSFVGDAQLPVTGQGEKRLVSYALDSKTSIDRSDKSEQIEDKITISEGLLNVSVKGRMETTYTVKAPAKEARTVIIEHPKLGGDYNLSSPDPKDVEVTATHYRVKVELKPGEKKIVPVVLENQYWQTYGIDGMATQQLLAYATGHGKLDAETRKAFAKLAEKRREMDAIDQQIMQLENERNVIFNDQQRVSQNLKALTEKSEVKQKYLDKLSAQEDKLEKIDATRAKLAEDRGEKQAELAGMISSLKI